MQVGTSKTKGLTLSVQAAVYPGALAAGTLHTTNIIFCISNPSFPSGFFLRVFDKSFIMTLRYIIGTVCRSFVHLFVSNVKMRLFFFTIRLHRIRKANTTSVHANSMT